MSHVSKDAHANLTGAWHGQYSFPVATMAPVPFAASLVQSGAFLGGSVTERATMGPIAGHRLLASLRGQRLGDQVSFLKTYEANAGSYTTAHYNGVVSADGLEIDGDWSVGGWSGRFLMIRAGGVAQSVARRVSERV